MGRTKEKSAVYICSYMYAPVYKYSVYVYALIQKDVLKQQDTGQTLISLLITHLRQMLAISLVRR